MNKKLYFIFFGIFLILISGCSSEKDNNDKILKSIILKDYKNFDKKILSYFVDFDDEDVKKISILDKDYSENIIKISKEKKFEVKGYSIKTNDSIYYYDGINSNLSFSNKENGGIELGKIKRYNELIIYRFKKNKYLNLTKNLNHLNSENNIIENKEILKNNLKGYYIKYKKNENFECEGPHCTALYNINELQKNLIMEKYIFEDEYKNQYSFTLKYHKDISKEDLNKFKKIIEEAEIK